MLVYKRLTLGRFLKVVAGKLFRKFQHLTVFNITRIRRYFNRDKSGVNVIGYFSSMFGVAESGRFFARQLIEMGMPFTIVNINTKEHRRLSSEELENYEQHFSRSPAYYKNIFFTNAEDVPNNYTKYPGLFLGKYNAAVFFWEFDDYFNFPKAFKILDEAIAYTDFVVAAIRKTAPPGFKVTKFNFPFTQNWKISHSVEEIRSRHAILQNQFVFIFNFDFHSILARKNPEALLRAFDIAFTETDDATLVLKTIHAEQKAEVFKKLQLFVDTLKIKKKVILINANLDRNEMMSMINASDVYVSLHRSEGLGLGIMEAMSMGKPVIATGYGGNLDFMNAENSLLVTYKLVPVEKNEKPYKKGWLWAEPDVEIAAGYMRKLYAERLFAKALGEKGKAYIEMKYNKGAFEKQLCAWINDK